MFYGQRLEDQKIYELLGGGSIHRNGFYIDVGAWSADVESVTKFFYDELNFSGINIEPVEKLYDQIVVARPRDINLCCAVGPKNDVAVMQVVCNQDQITGLSTLHKRNSESARSGRNSYEQRVDVFTLEYICDRYAYGQTIDFLKIDVEGFEKEVIYSGNWTKFRPKVLCIEATIPLTQIKSDEWHAYVLSICKYKFEGFDGLNNFYSRREGW